MTAGNEKNRRPLVICDFKTGSNGMDAQFITPDAAPAKCCGCFDCWFQTPTLCRFRDCAGTMSGRLAECTELILISQCTYGGYSEFVKTVLERCLSYVLPFFHAKKNKTAHYFRYRSKFRLRVLFYGDDVLPEERETAEQLCAANSFILSTSDLEISFFSTAEDALRYAERMIGSDEARREFGGVQ